MNKYFVVARLAMGYCFCASVLVFLYALPMIGPEALFISVATFAIAGVLMIPVCIFLPVLEQRIWQLPYSDGALLAFLGFVISIPGIVLLTGVQIAEGVNLREEAMIIIGGFLAGAAAVKFSRTNLLRRRMILKVTT